jgi:leucyl-tRNA synthetase
VQEYIVASDKLTDAEIGTIILQSAHKTIKKVTKDIDSNKYNTAIASIMEMTNVLYKQLQDHGIQKSSEWKFAIESLLQLLAPFAPHITEELWQQLGNTDSIHIDSWPKYDPELIKDDVMTIVIQVNGKLRGEFVVETGASKEVLENKAIELNNQKHYTKDFDIIKTVVVPGRLVNFVVKQ